MFAAPSCSEALNLCLILRHYIPGKAIVRSGKSYLVAGEESKKIELQCLFNSLWDFGPVAQQARTYVAGAGLG